MRVVLQRVAEASVRLPDESPPRVVARIEGGLLALAGFTSGDGEEAVSWMAGKIADLRIFPGEGGAMDRSLRETGGGLLLVSQFTLYADTRKGRRPDFTAAAPYASQSRARPPRRIRTWVQAAISANSMNSAYMRASCAYQTVNGATVARPAAA